MSEEMSNSDARIRNEIAIQSAYLSYYLNLAQQHREKLRFLLVTYISAAVSILLFQTADKASLAFLSTTEQLIFKIVMVFGAFIVLTLLYVGLGFHACQYIIACANRDYYNYLLKRLSRQIGSYEDKSIEILKAVTAVKRILPLRLTPYVIGWVIVLSALIAIGFIIQLIGYLGISEPIILYINPIHIAIIAISLTWIIITVKFYKELKRRRDAYKKINEKLVKMAGEDQGRDTKGPSEGSASEKV